MVTTIKETDGAAVASLEGRLDTAAAGQTEQALKPLYDTCCQIIVFDCQNLEYISSSGLRLLLSVLKHAKAKGGRVIISNLSTDLKKVFSMTGFDKLFDFK